MLKKTRLTREVLFWFNFCFFIMEFSKGIDSHLSLPCFFSICAIASLTSTAAVDPWHLKVEVAD